MNISVEKSDEGATLTISGELGIETAGELKSGIADALKSADRIDLNLAGVTSLDLCSMQLFCSAHRTAAVSGKHFTLVNAGEAFSMAMRNAGYIRHIGCRGDEMGCIWLG